MRLSRIRRRDSFTLKLNLYPQEAVPFDRIRTLAQEGFEYLDPDLVQLRDYQAAATAIILGGQNYGLNLDTARGKTIVAFLVVDKILGRGRVVFLAPQTALCDQHFRRAKERFSGLNSEEIGMVTGDVAREKRSAIYEKSRLVVATPQTFLNDLKAHRTSLEGVALFIFDEMQLASRSYAYIPIAKECAERKIQILGLTASAGGTKERIDRVKQNLCLASWLNPPSRRWDYAKDREVVWVPLEAALIEAKGYLWTAMRTAYDEMARVGLTKDHFPIISEKAMKEMRGRILLDLKATPDEYEKNRCYEMFSIWATYYKLLKAVRFLVAESYEEFLRFAEKLAKDKSRASTRIISDILFAAAVETVKELRRQGVGHPKQARLIELIRKIGARKRMIVFCRYIHTNSSLVETLNKAGIRAVSLIGKSRISTKKQTQIISEFEAGTYEVMVATAAGQVGLDMASVDCVIDYSVYQTGIEMIQRHGRGGRSGECRIFTLLMEDDLDRILHYASLRQRQTMREAARFDPGTIQAEALEAGEFPTPSIQTSLFSGRSKKEKGWVTEIKPGDLVHERFLVTAVRIRPSTKYGPSVWINLRDRTDHIRFFVNCADIVQAQELAWRIPKNRVCIVIAKAKEFKGETVLLADLRRREEEYNIITCPEGDYDQSDYAKNEPPDDF